jgi:hypothetical protein
MRPYFLLALVITGCGGITSGTEPTDAPAPPDAPVERDAATEIGKTCAGEDMPCISREDCCNSRHSCIGGACMYSAPVGANTGATYEADVQPLLFAKCAGCHDGDAGYPAFTRSYAAVWEPSKLCPGESIGACVHHALQAQAPEGSTCRTYVVRPFHREGWPCLTTTEINRVAAWFAGGMRER